MPLRPSDQRPREEDLRILDADLGGAAAPVFVGALGGSGTRALVEALEAAGWFFGGRLNRARDSLPGREFVRRWVPAVLRGELDGDGRRALREDLLQTMRLHRAGIPSADAPWGIKNPRWALLVPVVARAFPSSKFVHLVRDGRDMAFSANRLQLRDYGEELLPTRLSDAPAPVRAAAMWDAVNRRADDDASRLLTRDRYLLVRFEDLCAEPESAIAKLLAFLGASERRCANAAARIAAPASIGRHAREDPALVAAVTDAAAEGLRKFGYLR